MDSIKTYEYQTLRIDVFDSVEEGFYCQVHMYDRIGSTHGFPTQESAEHAAECMAMGYVYALYDAQSFLNREFSGLLGKLVELR